MAEISQKTLAESIKTLKNLLKGESADLWAVSLYGIAIAILYLVVPIAIQSVVNTVALGGLQQPLFVLSTTVLVALLIAGSMRGMQRYLIEILERRLIVRVSLNLAERLAKIKKGFLIDTFGPDYINRFLEVFVIKRTLAGLLFDGIAAFIAAPITLVLLAFYHPYFLIFALLIITLVILHLALFSRGGINAALRESNAKYDVLAWLEDVATVPISARMPPGYAYVINQADRLVNRYLTCKKEYFKIIFRNQLGSYLLQAISISTLLGLGGILVMRGQLTLGQLVAAEIALSASLANLISLTKHLEDFFKLVASSTKLEGLLSVPTENNAPEILSVSGKPAEVEFINIGFDSKNRSVVKNINLTLKPGDRVVIFGANGSGKSGLVSIPYRLNTTYSGIVKIDGVNVSDLELDSLRSTIHLTQGIEIVHGTIEENLRFGRTDLSLKEIRQAIDSVGLNNVIQELPDGIHEFIRAGGPLSSGQMYKLIIARAILTKPRFLIIDGTLDYVDDESIPSLVKLLSAEHQPWTLLVTTHSEQIAGFFSRSYELTKNGLEPISVTCQRNRT